MNKPVRGSLKNHPVLDPDILGGLRLLEADAGTGKTWTIARLVLRAVVEKDIGIDQIAVLTFTKAAAAELSERIGMLFDQWLTDSPELADDPFTLDWQVPVDPAVMKARLRVARLQLDDASIGTIHGFCQRVMTENALSIGRVDRPEPGPSDAQPLSEAIASWWRENIVNDKIGIASLCGDGGLSRDRLTKVLKPALQDTQATIAVPSVSGEVGTLAARLDTAVQSARDSLEEEYDALMQWASGDTGLNGNKYRDLSGNITRALQWLNDYPVSMPRDSADLKQLDRRRIDTSWNAKADHRAADAFNAPDLIAGLIDLMRERSALPSLVAANIREEIGLATRAIERARGTISFDDLLEQTRVALHEPVIGEQLSTALRNQFPVMFVDEFQDTDPAQWAVFEKIYRPENAELAQGSATGTALILVGDPKQAIYSFRNADIHTYLNARDLCEKIYRLEHNHRSNGGLINAVNTIFSRPDSFASPRISFLPASPGRVATSKEQEPPDDGRGSLCFVQLGDIAEPAEKCQVSELEKRSVQATCNEIATLIAKGHAQASDIAVLVPATARGGKIRDGLLQRGIGAVEIRRDSVFANNDARDLFRVICAIASPARVDLARGALITALLGADLSDLNALSEDPAQWQRLLLALDEAGRRWIAHGPQAALRGLIFGHFGRAEQLMAVENGERRLTNVLHLISLLSDEPSAAASAAQAQAWLGRQIQLVNDQRYAADNPMAAEEQQLRLESDDNLVRIITVHTSKGLQFPFVFLPFAYPPPKSVGNGVYRIHETDVQRVIADGTVGPWADAAGPGGTEHFKGIAVYEQFQEILRLAYVALTRAQRRCYVCWGGVDRSTALAAIPWLLDHGCPVPTSKLLTNSKEKNAQRVNEQTILDTQKEMSGNSAAVSTVNWQKVLLPQPKETTADSEPADTGLQLATLDRAINTSWQMRSFTSLARGAHGGATELPDHDQDQSAALVESVDTQATTDPEGALHAAAATFPRGANSGTCLHAILENAAFDTTVSTDLVSTVLSQYGLTGDPAQVSDWLTQVLNSGLPDPENPERMHRLSRFSETQTIRELPYTLSADGLDPASVAQCINKSYSMPSLSGTVYDGFLTGFIDLIVRSDDGRYWILDYKSNWLGDKAGDYGQRGMDQAMSDHAYSLQVCLYSLALHRMLRQKQANYEYAKHFGGVWYLFLRGMGAGESSNGVYTTKPSLALLNELDGLVGKPNV